METIKDIAELIIMLMACGLFIYLYINTYKTSGKHKTEMKELHINMGYLKLQSDTIDHLRSIMNNYNSSVCVELLNKLEDFWKKENEILKDEGIEITQKNPANKQ